MLNRRQALGGYFVTDTTERIADSIMRFWLAAAEDDGLREWWESGDSAECAREMAEAIAGDVGRELHVQGMRRAADIADSYWAQRRVSVPPREIAERIRTEAEGVQ